MEVEGKPAAGTRTDELSWMTVPRPMRRGGVGYKWPTFSLPGDQVCVVLWVWMTRSRTLRPGMECNLKLTSFALPEKVINQSSHCTIFLFSSFNNCQFRRYCCLLNHPLDRSQRRTLTSTPFTHTVHAGTSTCIVEIQHIAGSDICCRNRYA